MSNIIYLFNKYINIVCALKSMILMVVFLDYIVDWISVFIIISIMCKYLNINNFLMYKRNHAWY